MDSYIVSARKYRPSTFETVIGQSAITTTLKNAIKQQQLAQAFLFCGPRGVGKTTCARILAKTINCQNITEQVEPCGKCESCLNFDTSASFNIYELDAASNNSVDDIRSLIDQVRIPPQAGKYKVYIIDEVHMLSQQAFNAFLKTLEEPPSYAKFILATTEKHKVIPTILSRCQIFDFKRITVDDIIAQLRYVARQQEITAEEDALMIIAQKADGSMRDGLSIFDQMANFSGNQVTYLNVIDSLNVLDYEYFFNFVSHFLNHDIPSSLLLLADVIDRGFEGQHFLSGLAAHLRNLLISHDAQTIKLLDVGENLRSRYLSQAGACPAPFLLQALDLCNQYDLSYKSSNHKRLHLEILLTRLCTLVGQSMGTIQTIAENEKKKPDLPVDHPAAPPATRAAEIPVPLTKNGNSRPAAPPKPSVSIKDLSREISKETKEEEVLNQEDLPADPVDPDKLLQLWLDYAETQKENTPGLYAALMKRKPELREANLIEFMVDSHALETDLKQRRKDLLAFLWKGLNNFRIDINIIIVTGTREDKPYTNFDKFKKMAEQNPAIIELKREFDLEAEV